jgi:type IV pilus assembly protein PilE
MRRSRGTTLIELVVVLVIVGIVASMAIPGYRRHVLRTHRTEAMAALLSLAAAQEKFYLQHDTYAGTGDLATAPPNGLGLQATTRHGWYALEIAAGADADGYAATATAVGSQAADTHCASFALDQAGTRTATHADCW